MPWTVSDLLSRATGRLAAAGGDSPRLDADLLLAHALGIDRTRLLASLRDEPPLEDAKALDALLDRRLRGEPVAYLTGAREFGRHRFVVDARVLIPRPETELMVEWAVAWLSTRPGSRVVDVGTGSGAIAVSVAQLAPPDPDRTILAIDASPDAIVVAHDNARSAGVKITFAVGDLLADRPGTFDLILANLPYLTPEQIDGNPGLAAEPRLALDGGPDGLDLIRRLIAGLPTSLSANGAVALEIDPAQAATVRALLAGTLPDARLVVHPDFAGFARVVTAERGVDTSR